MINFLICMGMLGQVVSIPESRTSQADYQHKLQVATPELSSTTVNVQKRSEFLRRYQAVVKAMNAFSDRFNALGGHGWPQKEARRLQKALRALGEVEPQLSAKAD